MKAIDLIPEKKYVWLMGAEELLITFVGISKPSLLVKCSSSIGHGWVFQWPDGSFFEVGIHTIKHYIQEQPVNENEIPWSQPNKLF